MLTSIYVLLSVVFAVLAIKYFFVWLREKLEEDFYTIQHWKEYTTNEKISNIGQIVRDFAIAGGIAFVVFLFLYFFFLD